MFVSFTIPERYVSTSVPPAFTKAASRSATPGFSMKSIGATTSL